MTAMERRIRLSSMIVLLGLFVECATFAWKSPLAFFLFLFGGCGIVAVGIVLFLVSLITVDQGGAKS
jgi:hypothetical protein